MCLLCRLHRVGALATLSDAVFCITMHSLFEIAWPRNVTKTESKALLYCENCFILCMHSVCIFCCICISWLAAHREAHEPFLCPTLPNLTPHWLQQTRSKLRRLLGRQQRKGVDSPRFSQRTSLTFSQRITLQPQDLAVGCMRACRDILSSAQSAYVPLMLPMQPNTAPLKRSGS